MESFAFLLVIASAAVAQGFVKGGYSEPNPSTSVTFVNRGVPNGVSNPVGIPANGATVTLNVNGAHTLAGEVILHHVLYNGNGGPVVNSAGLPIGTNPFNRGLTQVLQLHNGRNQNAGAMTLPSNNAGAEILAQYFAAHGHHEPGPSTVHISPPGPVYHIDEHRISGMNPGTLYPQSMIYSQQTLDPQIQNQQIIQTRPQISQQAQRNHQINAQISQQLNQQQQQQQRGSQGQIQQISQISQLQQRPGSQISGQQINQQPQRNGQITFLPGTRKPNELTVIERSDGTGDQSGRLPGMPTLAEITSQLSGINGQSTKTV